MPNTFGIKAKRVGAFNNVPSRAGGPGSFASYVDRAPLDRPLSAISAS